MSLWQAVSYTEMHTNIISRATLHEGIEFHNLTTMHPKVPLVQMRVHMKMTTNNKNGTPTFPRKRQPLCCVVCVCVRLCVGLCFMPLSQWPVVLNTSTQFSSGSTQNGREFARS